MTILFYSPIVDEAGQRFQKEIEAAILNEPLEIHRDIESLNRRLRQPRYDLDIAVLNAGSNENLEELLCMRELFDSIRLILILHDREVETVRKGHTLFPRFLTYVDSDFDWVTAVLKKMLLNNHDGKN